MEGGLWGGRFAGGGASSRLRGMTTPSRAEPSPDGGWPAVRALWLALGGAGMPPATLGAPAARWQPALDQLAPLVASYPTLATAPEWRLPCAPIVGELLRRFARLVAPLLDAAPRREIVTPLHAAPGRRPELTQRQQRLPPRALPARQRCANGCGAGCAAEPGRPRTSARPQGPGARGRAYLPYWQRAPHRAATRVMSTMSSAPFWSRS